MQTIFNLPLAGAATGIIFIESKHNFCRGKHIFVATKDVFCRHKYVFVATIMILAAALSMI